jgi:nucleoside-diphosphate-sugar epimerase
MYAITGVTGNVGGAAARALLARGQSVRAVVRNPEKGQVWKDQGCEIALATIEDEAFHRCLSGSRSGLCARPSKLRSLSGIF